MTNAAWTRIGIAVFVVAGVLALTAHRSDGLPVFQHTSAGGLSNARCLEGGAWAVDLTITGTNPELHPKADITYTGNQIMGAPVPFGPHMFTTQAATFTASAHIVWSDGFTQNVGPWSASKPAGCTPPTTSTPPTTTCAEAIPPRTDCGGVPPTTATVPPTTVSPPVESTVVVPEEPSTSSSTVPPAPPTNPPAASERRVEQLPTTGVNPWVKALIGFVMGVVGVVAVLVTRRRKDALDG